VPPPQLEAHRHAQKHVHALRTLEQPLCRERALGEPDRLVVEVPVAQVVERDAYVAPRARTVGPREEVLAELHGHRAIQLAGIVVRGLVTLLQRLPELLVVWLAEQLRESAVERLLHLVVVEHVAPARRAHEAVLLLQVREALHGRDLL